MSDQPAVTGDVARRIHVSTELVLQPGAVDAARVITEFGSTTVRFTPADFGPYTGCTDVTFVAMAGNVADELRRLADRIHTPAAPSLRVVIDRAAEVPALTDEQQAAAARFIFNVLDEYVWCDRCSCLVSRASLRRHDTTVHTGGTRFHRVTFYGQGARDD